MNWVYGGCRRGFKFSKEMENRIELAFAWLFRHSSVVGEGYE